MKSAAIGAAYWSRTLRAVALFGAAVVWSTALASPASAGNGAPRCAQPVSGGLLPTATDCLYILNAAVGLQSCDCVCDPSGDGNSTATDALLCLNVAVGGPQELMCPCGTSTSTTSSTTVTSVTTTTLPVTTTTMGGPDPIAGQQDYDERCAFCHRAGNHDTTGDFGDLAGDGGLLVMDLGALDGFMNGLFMTQQEIDDMAAFLDGL